MTTIEWTHPPGFKGESWNPVTGCTKVSQGCKNCYAERDFPRAYAKTGRNFTDVRMHEDRLTKPLHARKPRCYFVNSMSDLFHEYVPDEFIDRVFAVMALATQHRFIVLTKRPKRMLRYCTGAGHDDGEYELAIDSEASRDAMIEGAAQALYERRTGEDASMWLAVHQPLPNVWLGVSVEDQETADERIPLLLQTPAAVRLVSYEPALGPVTFLSVDGPVDIYPGVKSPLDWIIVGGESGPRARPFDVAWARDTVQQCREAGVPVFVKQMGANVRDRNDAGFYAYEETWADGPDAGRPTNPTGWPGGDVEENPNGYREAYQGAPVRILLHDRKGGDPSEWPEDLRVREWPECPTPS